MAQSAVVAVLLVNSLLALTLAKAPTCTYRDLEGKRESTLNLIQREAQLKVPYKSNAQTIGFCGNENKTMLVEQLRADFLDKYALDVKNMFTDRGRPAIMIVGYQPRMNTDSSEGPWNLQNSLKDFLDNADRAAVADVPVYFDVVKMNLNRASFDICTSAPIFENINLECIDLSSWFDDVSGPECDLPLEVVLWARSQVYWKAVRESREGVLLLGMDVLLHRNLFEWIRDNRQFNNHIMTSTAWGVMNDCGDHISCVCGDVVFADQNSSDLIKEWAAQNIQFLDSQLGDQDSLNELVVNKGWHLHTDVIPPEIAGQCGKAGQYATHNNECWSV